MRSPTRLTISIGAMPYVRSTAGLCSSVSRRAVASSSLAVLMYSCFQISGAALAAYLPTFTSENGFTGAMAQIATLAPYGSAAVVRNLACMTVGG